MNTEMIDALIEQGSTAEELLEEAVPGAARRLKSAVASLNKLMKDVQKEFPDADWYLAMENMTLMLGPSHDADQRGRMHQERAAANAYLACSGGGDW